METAPISNKEEEDKNVVSNSNNVLPFKLLPGGKGPDHAYWLRDIPVNYLILVRPKPNMKEPQRALVANCLMVVHRTETCTRLVDQDQKLQFWAVTDAFSLAHECLEVIPLVFPDEQEGVPEDGHSDRPAGSGVDQDTPAS